MQPHCPPAALVGGSPSPCAAQACEGTQAPTTPTDHIGKWHAQMLMLMLTQAYTHTRCSTHLLTHKLLASVVQLGWQRRHALAASQQASPDPGPVAAAPHSLQSLHTAHSHASVAGQLGAGQEMAHGDDVTLTPPRPSFLPAAACMAAQVRCAEGKAGEGGSQAGPEAAGLHWGGPPHTSFPAQQPQPPSTCCCTCVCPYFLLPSPTAAAAQVQQAAFDSIAQQEPQDSTGRFGERCAESEHSAIAQQSHTIVCFHGKPKLLEKATVLLNAHRVMAKDKRKGTTKHNKDPGKKQKASRSPQGKQRQERRDGWATSRRQVIKLPEATQQLSLPSPPRLPRPSQHHSQAGGWTGTAMQR
ncbi:hypothetical protein HaLaN_03018 [Haematococcus lacustris]|uniref:Uncharacterized protein n=1 Tax=Haematococcus lacustris TaxID=44745 RepID=A0A699YDE2_HAELA|nr:hypothetical protein HaLaN_03018 [Haematococcus lacustris]